MFYEFFINDVGGFFAMKFHHLLAQFIARSIQSARLSLHLSELGPRTPSHASKRCYTVTPHPFVGYLNVYAYRSDLVIFFPV